MKSRYRRIWLFACVVCAFCGLDPQTVCQGQNRAIPRPPNVQAEQPAVAEPPQQADGLEAMAADNMAADDMATDDADAKVLLEHDLRTTYQPWLDAELHLLRRATQPDPQQRIKIRETADAKFAEVLKKYVHAQVHGQGGGAFAGGQVLMNFGGRIGARMIGPGMAMDPRDEIEQIVLRAAKDCLRAEQVDAYQDEIDKREDYRRQVTIDIIVAELADKFVLASDQRQKIAAAIAANWQPAWAQGIDAYLQNGEAFFPEMADHLVVPSLTDAQRKVWRERLRNHNQVWVGGFVGGMAVAQAQPVNWNEDLESDPVPNPKSDEGNREKPMEEKSPR